MGCMKDDNNRSDLRESGVDLSDIYVLRMDNNVTWTDEDKREDRPPILVWNIQC